MKAIDVSLNELISIADYEIIKGYVPTPEKLLDELDRSSEPLYIDDDLTNAIGKPCFLIMDNVKGKIKYIIKGHKFNKRVKTIALDMLDNIIFNLLYNDILEQLGDYCDVTKLRYEQSYANVLNIVDDLGSNCISDYEYSWLQILGNGKFNLLIL